MGTADKALHAWRKRRRIVKIFLTREAIDLLWLMTVSPGSQWATAHQYPWGTDGGIIEREIRAISKVVEDVFMKKPIMVETEVAAAIVKNLSDAYGVSGTREMKEKMWQAIQTVQPQKDYNAGEHGVKEAFVKRSLAMLEHYRKQPRKTDAHLAVHFADLEAALKGQKPPSAEDMLEDAPAPEAKP